MNDGLDTLSDDKLNEIFAMEVAALVFKPRSSGPDGCVIHQHWEDASGRWMDGWETQFSTDANAVLPHIGTRYFTSNRNPFNGTWIVDILGGQQVSATCDSFPRAACIALIRAKRAPI